MMVAILKIAIIVIVCLWLVSLIAGAFALPAIIWALVVALVVVWGLSELLKLF